MFIWLNSHVLRNYPVAVESRASQRIVYIHLSAALYRRRPGVTKHPSLKLFTSHPTTKQKFHLFTRTGSSVGKTPSPHLPSARAFTIHYSPHPLLPHFRASLLAPRALNTPPEFPLLTHSAHWETINHRRLTYHDKLAASQSDWSIH